MIVTAAHVRAAVKSTLAVWLPSTLVEARRNSPVADLFPVASWHTLVRADQLVSGKAQLPAVVIGPGAEEFTRHGDGRRSAVYDVPVTVVSRGQTFDDTVDRNDLYRAAVFTALVRHPDLGGFAVSTTVERGDYVPFPEDSARTLMGSVLTVRVRVDPVAVEEGPAVPPVDPEEIWAPATVLSTQVTVENRSA